MGSDNRLFLAAWVTLTASAFAATAQASESSRTWQPYFTVQVEGNALLGTDLSGTDQVGNGDISFDPGFGVGGALGLRFATGFRVETELMYRTLVDLEDFTSFAGAGAVFVQEADIDLERNDDSVSFQTSSFGAQLIAGGRYALNDYFYVESSLRWMIMGDNTLKSSSAPERRLVAAYAPISLSVGLGATF